MCIRDRYELTKYGRDIANSQSNLTPLVVAGLCYLLITIPLTILVKRPVSYTHLDVYKRQANPCSSPGRTSCTRTSPRPSRDEDNPAHQRPLRPFGRVGWGLSLIHI